MQVVLVVCFVVLFSACANSQKKAAASYQLAGGPCEGCEAIFEYGNKPLHPVDTLPQFLFSTNKLKVTGTIFKEDGKTPAEDVILYIYHTDSTGVYPTQGGEKDWARRHGYLRGWVKTGANGRYTFYTTRPAIYPSRQAPAHIHATLLEPGGKYYYLQDYHFACDELLTAAELQPQAPRGGTSGLLTLHKEGDMWIGERDIILGKNVPH